MGNADKMDSFVQILIQVVFYLKKNGKQKKKTNGFWEKLLDFVEKKKD